MTTTGTAPRPAPTKDWEVQEPWYPGQLAGKQIVNGRVIVVGGDPTTVYQPIWFFQYANDPSTILVDIDEVSASLGDEAKIEPGHMSVVESLQGNGRELMADEVHEMLLASKEPDGDPIQLFSLRAMAAFLVQHRDIVDPIAGPSPNGIMQLEWHILEDGLLVIAFVEDERVHCVIQANAMDNVSERMSTDALIEQHGYLIPTRDDALN